MVWLNMPLRVYNHQTHRENRHWNDGERIRGVIMSHPHMAVIQRLPQESSDVFLN